MTQFLYKRTMRQFYSKKSPLLLFGLFCLTLICFWACSKKDQSSLSKEKLNVFFAYAGTNATIKSAIDQLQQLNADSPFTITSREMAIWDNPVSSGSLGKVNSFDMLFPVIGQDSLLSGYCKVTVEKG